MEEFKMKKLPDWAKIVIGIAAGAFIILAIQYGVPSDLPEVDGSK